MKMLDLFAGLGGASQAMKLRGWDVTTLELEAKFKPDLCMSIADYHPKEGEFDFVWASPPCTEFSRESMPWCRTGKIPSLDLLGEAIRVIVEAKPKFWAIENVRGSIKYFTPILGEPRIRASPVFVWGELPDSVPRKIKVAPWKTKLSSKDHAKRSMIPMPISLAVAEGLEVELRRK